MIDKNSGIYIRMTMMRKGLNGDGRVPNLFEPEKKGVNKIMDIIDKHTEITDNEISQIQNELNIVENSNHYNGSAWYDFKLHLSGLLAQINYDIIFDKENIVESIKRKSDAN